MERRASLSIDDIKHLTSHFRRQIKNASIEMIICVTPIHFNDLRIWDNELDILTEGVDKLRAQYVASSGQNDGQLTELKNLIMKIQSIQNLIERSG